MTSFTVAIPTHNRRETVVLAALSAIRQTRLPEEVIVLCDGCTDGTSDAIAALGEPRIRAIDLPKGEGYAYAHRNVAVEEGRGDVITWLADDDLYLPDHFERIGRLWDTGSFDIVTTPAVIVHEDDRLEWIGRDWRIPEHRRVLLHETNTSVMASVSVRRQVVADVGGWDGSFERAADWDLWKRVIERGARPAMTHAATVLHFRATTRQQAWSLRVAQNTRWLEEIGDEARLAALRDELRLARSEFEGRLSAARHEAEEAHRESYSWAVERWDKIVELTAELEVAREAIAARDVRVQHEFDRASAAEALVATRDAELADARRAVGGARAERDALAESATRDRETLQQIYAGGWWRLRSLLRAPLAAATAARRTLSRDDRQQIDA